MVMHIVPFLIPKDTLLFFTGTGKIRPWEFYDTYRKRGLFSPFISLFTCCKSNHGLFPTYFREMLSMMQSETMTIAFSLLRFIDVATPFSLSTCFATLGERAYAIKTEGKNEKNYVDVLNAAIMIADMKHKFPNVPIDRDALIVNSFVAVHAKNHKGKSILSPPTVGEVLERVKLATGVYPDNIREACAREDASTSSAIKKVFPRVTKLRQATSIRDAKSEFRKTFDKLPLPHNLAGFARLSTGHGSKEVDACVKRRRFSEDDISMSTHNLGRFEKQQQQWNFLQVVVKAQEQKISVTDMDEEQIRSIVAATTQIPTRPKRKPAPQKTTTQHRSLKRKPVPQ
jgi:hypothetical protein